MRQYKVMIGTLHNDEADMPFSLLSVRKQKYPCSHIIFSGLPEVAAHKQLYRTFSNSDFDYLIKLDADMIFHDENSVQTMVDMIRSTELCRVTFLADDYFTGHAIQGIHIYSKKMKWWFSEFKENDLRSDRVDNIHRPEWWRRLFSIYPKTKVIDKSVIWHARYANEFQGFCFAFRRFFKRSPHLLLAFENYLKHPESIALQGVCRGIMAASEVSECELRKIKEIFEEYKNSEIDTSFIQRKLQRLIVD